MTTNNSSIIPFVAPAAVPMREVSPTEQRLFEISKQTEAELIALGEEYKAYPETLQKMIRAKAKAMYEGNLARMAAIYRADHFVNSPGQRWLRKMNGSQKDFEMVDGELRERQPED